MDAAAQRDFFAFWREEAVCQREDPELFFPIGDTGPMLLQIDEAKAVCGRCPVRASCLAWAMRVQVGGIWGGTTEAERRLMRRPAVRLRHGEEPGAEAA
ncbi:Transcriptional regulator WhiB [Streptomyces sp. RB5]|uniref:Transcriptional regulator WhiB n=1 Tax=Streptomyces smaragdinus TaxID=2585196 RepID=A0A7K0CJ91_9ACTN|nr:WhiB family transcriptional regulator [Streptomyces smaragdinus]MQY13555.1 Transcriptional regulator WhiB [Streptomyces smaragdinus]